MIGDLVNLPNRTVERQRVMQNDTRPIFYRTKYRPAMLRVFGVTFAAGAAGSVYGLFLLIKGK